MLHTGNCRELEHLKKTSRVFQHETRCRREGTHAGGAALIFGLDDAERLLDFLKLIS